MREIRIHGRGGQGNVAAAELLSVAAFTDGRYAQAFPAFGAERTGAPVVAFVRLSDRPIRLRSQVYHPDVVIVQDPSLLKAVDVLHGLKGDGTAIINTAVDPRQLELQTTAKVYSIPATEIALEVIGRPIPNTTLLGAFAGITGEVSLKAIQDSVRHRFGDRIGEINAKAVERAYQYVKALEPAVLAEANPSPAAVSPSTARALALGVVLPPATSLSYKTGTWRTSRPYFKHVTCTGCTLCAVICPEGCVYPLEKRKYTADYDYCKGCGMCAEECPVDDIDMTREVI